MTTEKKQMVKWDWEQVLSVVHENLPNWTVDQSEPEVFKSSMRVKMKCPNGHENEKYISNIKIGTGCKRCNRENAINECYKKFTELATSENYQMKSTLEEMLVMKGVPSFITLKLICPNGVIYSQTFTRFTERNRCQCADCKKTTQKRKPNKTMETIEEVNERFSEFNLKVLGEWNGLNKKVDGKLVEQKYKTLCLKCQRILDERNLNHVLRKRQTPCSYCSGSKYDLLSVLEWVGENRPEIFVPSQPYKNANTKMEFVCVEHEEHFMMRFASIQLGIIGCKHCNQTRRIEINKPMFEKYDIRGSLNSSWTGLTPLRKYLRGQIDEWKKLSLKSYGYKCAISGETFETIHHVCGFNLIVKDVVEQLQIPIYETIGEYTNEQLEQLSRQCLIEHYKHGLGVPLSEVHHNGFHKIYGRGDNTKQQFLEYIVHIGQDPNEWEERLNNSRSIID